MLCCFQLNYISTIFFTYFHIWLLKISGTKNCYWALSKLAHQGMKKLSHILKNCYWVLSKTSESSGCASNHSYLKLFWALLKTSRVII